MKWHWIVWQVAFPLLLPVGVTALAMVLWWTGSDSFSPDIKLLVENASPWALTFYSIALLGSTLEGIWAHLHVHPVLGATLILVAGAVCVYASFIAIWRHTPGWAPGEGVRTATLILLCVTIGLCHMGAKASAKES